MGRKIYKVRCLKPEKTGDLYGKQIYSLEKERNQLAYGKKSTEEKMKTLIGRFLDFKKEAENA